MSDTTTTIEDWDAKAWEIGDGNRLVWYGDTGEVGGQHFPDDLLWDHPGCEVLGRIDLMSGEKHRIVTGGRGDEEHMTIVASLLCTHCGAHGWLTDGRWVQA